MKIVFILTKTTPISEILHFEVLASMIGKANTTVDAMVRSKESIHWVHDTRPRLEMWQQKTVLGSQNVTHQDENSAVLSNLIQLKLQTKNHDSVAAQLSPLNNLGTPHCSGTIIAPLWSTTKGGLKSVIAKIHGILSEHLQ